MDYKRLKHKTVKKKEFRLKKHRQHKNSDLKRACKKREQVRKAARAQKSYLKKIKTITCLMKKYNSWWRWEYCRPANGLYYRLVIEIGLDYKKHEVVLKTDCGHFFTITAAGRWPCKADVEILEVTYNEKGNLLREVQASSCGRSRKDTTSTRGAS